MPTPDLDRWCGKPLASMTRAELTAALSSTYETMMLAFALLGRCAADLRACQETADADD